VVLGPSYVGAPGLPLKDPVSAQNRVIPRVILSQVRLYPYITVKMAVKCLRYVRKKGEPMARKTKGHTEARQIRVTRP